MEAHEDTPASPPFEQVPSVDCGHLSAWLVDSPGCYTWFSRPGRMMADDCEALVDKMSWSLLSARFIGKKVSFFHDWSMCHGYESKARHVMTDWALSIPKERIDRIVVQLSPTAPAIVRMGVATGAAALAIFGRRVEIADDGPSLASRYGMKAVSER